MKEATGELSMTVITIIVVIALIGIWTFLKDPIQNWVKNVFKNATTEVGMVVETIDMNI